MHDFGGVLGIRSLETMCSHQRNVAILDCLAGRWDSDICDWNCCWMYLWCWCGETVRMVTPFDVLFVRYRNDIGYPRSLYLLLKRVRHDSAFCASDLRCLQNPFDTLNLDKNAPVWRGKLNLLRRQETKMRGLAFLDGPTWNRSCCDFVIETCCICFGLIIWPTKNFQDR